MQMLRNNRGQMLTIIEILVVAVIIVGAGLWIARSYVGTGGGEPGKAATPKERALAVDCANNLRQLRGAIEMSREASEEGRPPKSLDDLASSGIRGLPVKCPVSGRAYSYDPNTARVWCTTPGHEKF